MGKSSNLDISASKLLEAVPHGFFGNNGGVDQFGYGGPGDEDLVRENRLKAANQILAGGLLSAPYQTHSSKVLIVTDGWIDEPKDRPEADGLVTASPGIVLGIVTADCAPILLADLKAGVVAAAHAGWKGAVNGVIENTLAAMSEIGARVDRVTAAIGPTIGLNSYEVGEDFKERFNSRDEDNFLQKYNGRWHFNLPRYVRDRLTSSGVTKIEDLGLDTYTVEDRYYSYRRSVHRLEPNYGRQASMIALP